MCEKGKSGKQVTANQNIYKEVHNKNDRPGDDGTLRSV